MDSSHRFSQANTTLNTLAKEYFTLPDGAMIEKHDEMIELFRISHPTHRKVSSIVCISRKSLKHFVERRKVEFSKKHNVKDAFENISFALSKIYEIITDFDSYEVVGMKHFYSKDFVSLKKPTLHLVIDEVHGRLEIRSIHFKRRRYSRSKENTA